MGNYNVIVGESKSFLVYIDSDHWFFKLFFKRHYNHCYLLIWDGYQWLRLDKGVYDTKVNTIECVSGTTLHNPNDLIPLLLQLDNTHRVQEVDETKVKALNKHTCNNFIVSMIRPNSCVETIKNYYGINRLRYITPYSLSKYIDLIN